MCSVKWGAGGNRLRNSRRCGGGSEDDSLTVAELELGISERLRQCEVTQTNSARKFLAYSNVDDSSEPPSCLLLHSVSSVVRKV